MKCHFYAITPDPEPQHQPVFRMFMHPAEQVDGTWRPSGPAVELDEEPMDIAFDVLAFRICGMPEGFGSLDEITPPRGWTVVARGWLPDDYTPPTQAERDQAEREAMAKWRQIQADMSRDA